jgi:predicted methyltransferase
MSYILKPRLACLISLALLLWSAAAVAQPTALSDVQPKLNAAINGPQRSLANANRDKYRHPQKSWSSLEFVPTCG